MKPIRRKRPRAVTILLFPLLAIAFLVGFSATIVGEQKEKRTKPKKRLQIHKPSNVVTLEVISNEEELQAH
jgi:hypothetical protein